MKSSVPRLGCQTVSGCQTGISSKLPNNEAWFTGWGATRHWCRLPGVYRRGYRIDLHHGNMRLGICHRQFVDGRWRMLTLQRVA
jgi:hypothetical protein